MPGGAERVLKRRIKSVQSTKKITRAMELIAATRVVKAQQRANAARPYAAKITGVIEDLAAAGTGVEHPLLRDVEQVRKVAYVIVTSDRGLAGPYNSAVIRAAERELQARQLEGVDYSLILIGKKAQEYFRFRNYRIDHAFSGMTDTPRYEQAREVAVAVRHMFEDGEVDQVLLAYQEFISIGTQRVALRRFLPLESMDVVAAEGAGSGQATALFEFEPSPRSVLADLLPRYVESRLFSALLDASASEHASRQRAMKAATDNAEELITKLTRQMNRARQDAITTEIMEIVGGAEALRSDTNEESDLLIGHLFGEHLFQQHLVPSTTGHATGSHHAGAQGHAEQTPGAAIKGNMDSMYYHRPDSRSYSVTKAEVWFETEEEAQAAGFKLAPTHPKTD